jgi:DNA-binding MarR family transcriptional regulator
MALHPDRLRATAAILAANIAIGAAIDHEAVNPSGHDATTADLLLRLHLADNNRLRAVDLCHQLMKSPSHISRILDRAEKSGFVRREADPDDRRAHQVVLLAAGSLVVERFSPAFDAVIERAIFSSLSTDEIESLIEMLERVEAAARASAE